MSSGAFSLSKNISYDRPEQPPGRTATRRLSSGWSSASSSSATLVVATSVRAIIANLHRGNARTRLPDGDRDPARVAVVQRRELHNASPADLADDAFGDAAVEIAHELGIGLGQLPERAVRERHVGLDAGRLGAGLETEPAHLGAQRLHAGAGTRALPGFRAPLAPDLGRFLAVGADALRERRQQTGKKGVARRVDPEPGRARRQRIHVGRPADGAAVHGLDFHETGLAEAVEMEAHGVGV